MCYLRTLPVYFEYAMDIAAKREIVLLAGFGSDTPCDGMFYLKMCIFVGQAPDDQVGVGIFYNNRRTRRLTGTFNQPLDLSIKQQKSSCAKCT